MKPAQRIAAIKKLSEALAKLDWDELDLTLRQFGLPTSDTWHTNDHKSYAIAHIENAEASTLAEPRGIPILAFRPHRCGSAKNIGRPRQEPLDGRTLPAVPKSHC